MSVGGEQPIRSKLSYNLQAEIVVILYITKLMINKGHLLSGPHLFHTSSVALLATGLLPASEGFISQNTRRGKASQLFNTLQPHKDPVSNINGVVTIETRALNSPHFSFTLTYPLFIYFILGWLTTTYQGGLPVQMGPSLLLKRFFLSRCDLALLSRPSLPPLLSPGQVDLS